MLTVRVAYTLKNHESAKFELNIRSNRGIPGVHATVSHENSGVAAHVEFPGYALWSESGYALIARCMRAAGPQLNQFCDSDEVVEMTISVNGAPANVPEQKELSKIAYSANGYARSVQVLGPVLRAVFPMQNNVGQELVGLLIKICEFCAISPIDYESMPPAPLALRYSGGIVEDFVFVNELPFDANPWFIAFVNTYKRKSIYREGTVAHASAWDAFLQGEIL